MPRPSDQPAAIRSVALSTVVFVLWAMLEFLQPVFWPITGTEAAAEPLHIVWGRRIYLIALWFLGAVMLHRWLCVFVLDGLAARALGRPIQKIFKDVQAMVLVVGACVGILVTVLGQSMASFWAASGAVGIVLGIALRPLILDFFAGLGANLDRAYSIGDWIVVSGTGDPIRGWIEEINWRTLRLRTRDGVIVMVPNSRLATSAVSNHSLPQPESRFQLRLRLDAEVGADRALRILSAALSAATSRTDGPRHTPAPEILVTDASAAGVEYAVRFWLDPSKTSPDTVTHVVWLCILDHLGKAGLTFAHPQENVFLARMPQVTQGYRQVDDRLAFLRRIALFHGFPDSSLRTLAAEVRMRAVRRGQMLFREGDVGDSMLLVAEGTLRVHRAAPDGIGQPLELATLEPGNLLGERSLLSGEPRNASVTALTECILMEITEESLRHLLASEPDLLPLLEKTVAEREAATRARMDASKSDNGHSSLPGKVQPFIQRMREMVLGRR